MEGGSWRDGGGLLTETSVVGAIHDLFSLEVRTERDGEQRRRGEGWGFLLRSSTEASD